MRPRHLALLLVALAPGAARALAPLATRALALELGFAEDSVPALGSRAPVALVGSQWLVGQVDATARIAWSSASRTGGRAADAVYEAGAGLRHGLGARGPLRPRLTVELGVVWADSRGAPGGVGMRLAGGAELEALLGNDLFLALVVQGSAAVLPGGGGLGGCASLRAGAYF